MRLFSFLGQVPVTRPRSSRCLRRGAQSDVILHRLIHPRSLPTQSCAILLQQAVDEPAWARLQGLLPLLLVWCSGVLLVSFLFSSGDAFQTEEDKKCTSTNGKRDFSSGFSSLDFFWSTVIVRLFFLRVLLRQNFVLLVVFLMEILDELELHNASYIFFFA